MWLCRFLIPDIIGLMQRPMYVRADYRRPSYRKTCLRNNGSIGETRESKGNSIMSAKRIFHVISNTHWDREWRFPFQKNRQMLVEMIDKVLEILEQNPQYRAFHLDSQTVVLQDYLEIKPQNRNRIEQLVKEDRLLIGPWYILPEEFQVGGENLIRNLLKGHEMAESLGKVMKVGYSPFSWGQISQLPQIYAGFAIDVIMFYRGINSLDSPKAEFRWIGSDGTEAFCSRFSTMPRYNFYFYIYRPVLFNEQVTDIEKQWSEEGLPFHFADAALKDEDYNRLQPPAHYYEGNIPRAVHNIIAKQAADFSSSHIFWAEGHDSSGPNNQTVRLINDIERYLDTDEVRHSTLPEYTEALQQSLTLHQLQTVTGERRSSQYDHRSGNLYGYTTSARMYLKQMNFDCERWLQFYAEPFNTLAGMLGMDIDDRYPDAAWQFLLQNSAHDSIGGCSMDEVHEDMVNRYKQCSEISKGIFGRAMKFFAQQIDLASYTEDSIHLVIINPNTFERSSICEAYIDIPRSLDQGFLEIIDENRSAVPIQYINADKVEPVLEQMIDRPMYYSMMRYHCYVQVDAVRPMGWKTLHVHPITDRRESGRKIAHKKNNHWVLENKNLHVTVNSNGTLNVFDKQNQTNYNGIGYLYDEGEAGHAWVHDAIGPLFTTLQEKPHIERITNGPLIAVIRMQWHWNLPKNLTERQQSVTSVILPITLDISLRKDSRLVEFDIQLDNRVEDHRLRLMFPLMLNAGWSHGEGQFDVVARSTFRPDTADWVEQPMYDYPMHQFVDVNNERQGAAVIVDGLKEYEVRDDKEQTLAITLLRAFKYGIQPSSYQDFSHQKGSQCPGQQRYRLAFMPHRGNWQEGKVYREALNYNHTVRLFQMGRSDGRLPAQSSLLNIEPETLVFSALKKARNGKPNQYILRLYNPTDQPVNGRITLSKLVKSAALVSLEEIEQQALNVLGSGVIEITVAAKKIVTLRFSVKGEDQ
ncbi:MAG: hypothetical protein GF313_14315 [Caldithrix sp.]|nr:hypothetical protein [Caldithrix sp.]